MPGKSRNSSSPWQTFFLLLLIVMQVMTGLKMKQNLDNRKAERKISKAKEDKQAILFAALNKPPAPPPTLVPKNSLTSYPSGLAWQQEPEEGIELEVNKIAKNYYIVIDGSGSMKKSGCSQGISKADAAINALESFSKLLPDTVHIGLLTFDEYGIRETLPLGIHTRKEFLDRVGVLVPGGGTPLLSAITDATKALELQGHKQLGYGEYTLVVVTDGEASEGEDPAPIVKYILDKTPIKLQTIGFCIGEDRSLNQPGRTSYQTAQNAEELVKELSNVLAEADHFNQSTFPGVP